MPQPWPQPAPRIVKLADLADTDGSAWAGIIVNAVEAAITMSAVAAPRNRLIKFRAAVLPNVGEGDMTRPFVGSGHSLQHVNCDTQVKEKD
jgi:hypothetical protein